MSTPTQEGHAFCEQGSKLRLRLTDVMGLRAEAERSARYWQRMETEVRSHILEHQATKAGCSC